LSLNIKKRQFFFEEKQKKWTRGRNGVQSTLQNEVLQWNHEAPGFCEAKMAPLKISFL